MRQAFVHDAVVTVAPGGDLRAPGAAITVALCGHCEPAAEAEVRGRIEAALAESGLTGPDGVATRWQLRSAQPGLLRADEAAHAERLIRG